MTHKLLFKKNIIYQVSLWGLLLMIGITKSYAQTPPPVTNGSTEQYFCSATSWMNAGFTEPGDTFEELYIEGENLKFYDSNGNLIPNPSNYTLVDGASYEVTQTINGIESAPINITVTDRECGCIKNHDFETIDGQPDGSEYNYLDSDNDRAHKTCGGSSQGANTIALGPVDANTGNAVLVTPGIDPNVNGHPRVNSNNQYSDYALRLGDDAYREVAYATKDFIAGEVFVFNFSAVLENPAGHDYEEQPYMYVTIYDENGDIFTSRCIVSQQEDCILFGNAGGVLYSEWSCLKINTLPLIGEKATIEFSVADCTLDGHWGYAYIDDIFVGDNIDSGCGDPSFGYIAMEEVKSNPTTLDCVVDVAGASQSCGADINASVPFPVEVCGTLKTPISNNNPPNIEDLTLSITQNGVQVGTATNPSINGDQFCFTIDASDVNVSPYGQFEISSYVEFTLDCGEPYGIEITDAAQIDVCPTIASCVQPLSTCDDTGSGIGTFDLTQASNQIRGTEWTAADVDITYYRDEFDALDEQNAISSPENYSNTNPFSDQVYARLDWNLQGSNTNCFYIVTVDVNVYKDPDVNIPDELASCNTSTFNVPIVATPENVDELTDVTYTWKKNNQLLAFSGSYYEATSPGTYEVTVEEQNCSVTKTVEVLAVDYDAKVGDDNMVEICGTNATANLEVEVIDNSNQPMDMSEVTYLWSTGQNTKEIEVSQTGNYFVDVMYKNCIQTTAVTVILNKQPDVEVGENILICNGQSTSLTATVSNYEDISNLEFNWLRNGTAINETSQTIEVTQDGDYAVEVNEVGTPDCTGVDELNVSYYANENCVITQGISPGNLDGFNDCLDLTFLNDRSGIAKLTLFNRYGRIIYEENNYVKSWCGQDQDGNDLPTGTYYYVIELDQEDPVFDKNTKGWIYVNREVN